MLCCLNGCVTYLGTSAIVPGRPATFTTDNMSSWTDLAHSIDRAASLDYTVQAIGPKVLQDSDHRAST
jgi:hypothetical protein